MVEWMILHRILFIQISFKNIMMMNEISRLSEQASPISNVKSQYSNYIKKKSCILREGDLIYAAEMRYIKQFFALMSNICLNNKEANLKALYLFLEENSGS